MQAAASFGARDVRLGRAWSNMNRARCIGRLELFILTCAAIVGAVPLSVHRRFAYFDRMRRELRGTSLPFLLVSSAGCHQQNIPSGADASPSARAKQKSGTSTVFMFTDQRAVLHA